MNWASRKDVDGAEDLETKGAQGLILIHSPGKARPFRSCVCNPSNPFWGLSCPIKGHLCSCKMCVREICTENKLLLMSGVHKILQVIPEYGASGYGILG